MLTFKEIVPFISDIAALLLMITTLIHSKKHTQKDDLEGRIFHAFLWMGLGMTGAYIANAVITAGHFHLTPGEILMAAPERAAEILFATVAMAAQELLTAAFYMMWLMFVSYRLYHSRDFLKRRFWVMVSPISACTIVVVFVELWIIFSRKVGLPFLITMLTAYTVNVIYFILSLVRLYIYKKQNGYVKFFRASAMIIPVIVGFIADWCVNITPGAFPLALGITLLYLSIQAERHFQDPETGFYNDDFISFLKKASKKEIFKPCSAMVFEVEEAGKMKDFAVTLKKQLPKHCETIRHGEKQAVVLTQIPDTAPLSMVLEDVKLASGTEGYFVLRKKDETAIGFLERVMQ